MRLKLVLAVAAGLAALAVLTACGNDEEARDASPPTRAPTTVAPDGAASATPTPEGRATPGDSAGAESVPVDAARAHLADRLGIETAAIAVVSAEAVDWPNACLGAARPDEACAQVITPGYRVVLVAGDAEYEYHTDRGTHVRPAP